jgi:hypothetical protein
VADFDFISCTQFQGLSYCTAAINGNNDASYLLINRDIFAVYTNAGNYVRVQALSYGYNLNSKWIAYTTTPVNAPLATTISSGTSTLQGTYEFDFDCGTEITTDADVWWKQGANVVRAMQMCNGAQITNNGVVDFDSVAPVQPLSLSYGTASLRGNNDVGIVLINRDVFAMHTTAGNYAKMQVLNFGYNLKIRWVTYKITLRSSGLSKRTHNTGPNLY